MDGATETRQPATSVLHASSGEDGAGSAPTYSGCCTSSTMDAGGGPKLAASGGSRPPPSLAWAWHMGELAALDDGELGGSRSTSEHPPDVLLHLDGQGSGPRLKRTTWLSCTLVKGHYFLGCALLEKEECALAVKEFMKVWTFNNIQLLNWL